MPRVLIPLAQGCEELEAVTIIDLLRRADIEVITAGLDSYPVTGARGTVLVPDTMLDSVADETFDMVVLPGGLPGADNLREDQRIIQLLQRHANQGHYIAAICAAPKVLAHAGLLDNHKATSYPGSLDEFNLNSDNLSQAAIVVDGKITTSRGPGTAMDFSLALIEQLTSKQKRDEVERPLLRP